MATTDPGTTTSDERPARWGKPAWLTRPRLLGLVAVVLALVVVAALALNGRDAVSRPGYQLIFNDEFDGSSLDYFRWNAQDLPSPRNNELQYYTPNNVRVENGELRLTSRREEFQGRGYTSAAVDTSKKFSFTYGRVEIRAKLPEMGQGIWPALWMLGAGCNPVGGPCPWPTAGSNEIDIMEVVNSPSTLYNDLHFGTAVGKTLSPGPCSRAVPDLSAGFHDFSVEWEPGGVVRWYLDDEQVCERKVPGSFDTPMYLFLNTAVGGDWPGPPAADTHFPQEFRVEHVRVYQKR